MKDMDILKVISGVMIGVGSLLVVSSLTGMKKRKKNTNTPITKIVPKGTTLNARQKKIVRKYNEVGIVTIADVQDMFKKVTDRTLRRDLTDLVSKGVLKKEGSTKSAKYIFS